MTSTNLPINKIGIEEAVATLVKKIREVGAIEEWYEDYFRMTESALVCPDKNFYGDELGDVLFCAIPMVYEITEVGGVVYHLPEFQKLLKLMEDAEYVKDRQKMTEEEYKNFLRGMYELSDEGE